LTRGRLKGTSFGEGGKTLASTPGKEKERRQLSNLHICGRKPSLERRKETASQKCEKEGAPKEKK